MKLKILIYISISSLWRCFVLVYELILPFWTAVGICSWPQLRQMGIFKKIRKEVSHVFRFANQMFGNICFETKIDHWLRTHRLQSDIFCLLGSAACFWPWIFLSDFFILSTSIIFPNSIGFNNVVMSRMEYGDVNSFFDITLHFLGYQRIFKEFWQYSFSQF